MTTAMNTRRKQKRDIIELHHNHITINGTQRIGSTENVKQN